MSTKTAHAPTDSEVASRVALDVAGADDSNSSESDTKTEAIAPARPPKTGSATLPSLSELRKEADAAGVDISDLSPQKRGRPTHAAKREMEARIAAAKAEAPETCVDSPEETHGTGPGTARLDPALEELLGMEPFSDGNAVDRASPQPRMECRKVADLRPNEQNAKVFNASLSEEAIEPLVEHLRVHGLLQPLVVRDDGLILIGERRWRGMLSIDSDAEVDVVVVPAAETAEEIEDLLVDEFSCHRDASVGERVNMFAAAKRVYSRRYGRPPGNQPKDSRAETLWEPERIRELAARRAGFGSYTSAQKAVKVFAEGSEQMKAAVNAGEISANTAYEKLAKATKKKKTAKADGGQSGGAARTSESAVASGGSDVDQHGAVGTGDERASTAPNNPRSAEAEMAITDSVSSQGDEGEPVEAGKATAENDEAVDNVHYTRNEQLGDSGTQSVESAAAAESTESDDEGDEPDIARDQARERVRREAEHDPGFAHDLVNELATRAGFEVWIANGKDKIDVYELKHLMRWAWDRVAARDREAAGNAVSTFLEEIREKDAHVSGVEDE